MEEKRVLVIGAGSYSKRKMFSDAKKSGIKVILIDFNPNCRAAEDVHKFIHYNFTDHNQDNVHARNIANLIRHEGVHVDGCLAFHDECTPLASAVAELLDTTGNIYEASSNAKRKSCTQSILLKRYGSQRLPRTCHYVSDVQKITSLEDVVDVNTKIEFPCILKLEHGTGSVGVSLCTSKNDIMSQYKHVTDILSKEEDLPGIGLGFSNTMMVMNYWEGSKHNVNVVIYNRKLVTAIIIDNGPTNGTSFTNTSACMPSQLPLEKQGQLVTAALQCCSGLGLENGVFNVEMIMTACGPKLIEINARMGGFYLRDWSHYIYGIDLALAAMMIACDVRPFLFKPEVTKEIVGIILVPSQHKHILLDNGKLEMLRTMHENKEILFSEFYYEEEYGKQTDMYEQAEANIAVVCKTLEECKARLMKVCWEFDITSDAYNVESFIKAF